MIIKSLSFKGFRGLNTFTGAFKYNGIIFSPYYNCITGSNGAGKTSVMQLLAALTGNEAALNEIIEEPIEFCKIVVVNDLDDEVSLKFSCGFDEEKIRTFKTNIGSPSSFVLTHNTEDDRFVTIRADPKENFDHSLQFLDSVNLHPSKQLCVQEGYGATVLMERASGQHYLFTVGMRIAPLSVPMLIEHPERHLHPNICRNVFEFFKREEIGWDENGNGIRPKEIGQNIVTSHSPFFAVNFSSNSPQYLIDLNL